jgi:hypothetical protein
VVKARAFGSRPSLFGIDSWKERLLDLLDESNRSLKLCSLRKSLII